METSYITELRPHIQKICETQNSILPGTFTMDWGSNRGQGKRVGSQVLGSMSDAPQGIKSYRDPLGNVQGIEDMTVIDKQIILQSPLSELLYLKARSAELSHDIALTAVCLLDCIDAYPDLAGPLMEAAKRDYRNQKVG